MNIAARSNFYSLIFLWRLTTEQTEEQRTGYRFWGFVSELSINEQAVPQEADRAWGKGCI
jgi:hypothetical protein